MTPTGSPGLLLLMRWRKRRAPHDYFLMRRSYILLTKKRVGRSVYTNEANPDAYFVRSLGLLLEEEIDEDDEEEEEGRHGHITITNRINMLHIASSAGRGDGRRG